MSGRHSHVTSKPESLKVTILVAAIATTADTQGENQNETGMKTQGQRQAEHEQWKEKGVKEQESDRDLQMRGAFDFYVFTLFTSNPPPPKQISCLLSGP